MLFIGEASWSNVMTVKRIFRCFELALSLKVNFFKSCFAAFGVDMHLMTRYADYLNYKLLTIPFTIPIGANPRRDITLKPIMDKLHSKLSKWKHKLFSFARRASLINFVLWSLPLFFFLSLNCLHLWGRNLWPS